MAGRERNRIILAEIVSAQVLGPKITAEKIMASYKDSVLHMWGERGLGTVALPSKIILSFSELGGFFIAKVPSLYQREALASFSCVVDICSKPVTIRVISVSGRLKTIVVQTMHKILDWRHNLPVNYSVSRKSELDALVRGSIADLAALPKYV